MKKTFRIILYAILVVVLIIACIIGYSVVAMKMNAKKTDSGGTWHPSGGLIAYSSKASGDFEIYAISLPENTETRLTFNNQSDDLYPAYSPNGAWIAYVSMTRGESDLYLMDFEGENNKQLTTVHAVYNGSFCSWSPDGEKIAFSANHEGNYEIYTIHLDGSNLTNITRHEASDRFPSWSPDGQSIVFTSDREGSNSLFVVNLDGSNHIQLTSSHNDISADWSTATNKIIFQRRLTRFKSQLFSINPDDKQLVSITNGDDLEFYPKWSPEGIKVLYTAGNMTNSDLFYRTIETKEVTQLTHDE